MSNRTLGPLDKTIEILKKQLDEEKANTNFPGNPFINALSGRISGMEQVLDHPIYSLAPEMLEALVLIRKYAGSRDNEGLDGYERGSRMADDLIKKLKDAT